MSVCRGRIVLRDGRRLALHPDVVKHPFDLLDHVESGADRQHKASGHMDRRDGAILQAIAHPLGRQSCSAERDRDRAAVKTAVHELVGILLNPCGASAILNLCLSLSATGYPPFVLAFVPAPGVPIGLDP